MFPYTCFFVCMFCTFAFAPLVLISGDFWKSLPVLWILFRKICLPIKCPFWLQVSFIYFKSFLLSLDIVNLCIYVITKKPLWRYWHTFARRYNSLGNDKAMFVLLMESASWFAWPKNIIASVQVLMTGMIDSLMSLAVNSLLFSSFTKSFE